MGPGFTGFIDRAALQANVAVRCERCAGPNLDGATVCQWCGAVLPVAASATYPPPLHFDNVASASPVIAPRPAGEATPGAGWAQPPSPYDAWANHGEDEDDDGSYWSASRIIQLVMYGSMILVYLWAIITNH